MLVRQSTPRTIIIGPILDADGVAKTDEVVGSIKVHKEGGVAAALDGAATLTHSHTGFYRLAYTANDVNTPGITEFTLDSGTNSMPVKSVNVLMSSAWDAMHHATLGGLRTDISVKFASMVELDGGVYRYTTSALEQSGAGDATLANQATIIADIAAISSAIGSGTGARSILVTVTDGSDPLENVTVRFSEGATTNVALTDASGERTFGLDDATWDYVATKPGYTSVIGTHVVNSSETPLNIELTLNAVTPPSDPVLCRVSLDLYKNGVPVSGATFEAKFVDTNQAIDNIVFSKQIDEDTTDANGHADLDLVRLDQFISSDGLYQIRVIHPDTTVSLDIKTTIPNQSNVNVQDLIP